MTDKDPTPAKVLADAAQMCLRLAEIAQECGTELALLANTLGAERQSARKLDPSPNETTPETPLVTLEVVTQATQDAVKEGRREEVVKTLAEFGVKKASDLFPGDYLAYVEMLKGGE